MTGSVNSELVQCQRVLLAALYLRGVERFAQPDRRNWPRVVACLQKRCSTLESVESDLASDGFELESLLAADSRLRHMAGVLVANGQVLTALCEHYFPSWLEKLGPSAPPCLWWNGVSYSASSTVAIVGSRNISRRIASQVTAWSSQLRAQGFTIVSGGAVGCDRAAGNGAWRAEAQSEMELDRRSLFGAAPIVEILPNGLAHGGSRKSAQISAWPPDDSFSTAAAMERNAWIYASSRKVIVAHARSRSGGSWHGAVDALRRRLCQVYTWDDPANEAASELIALGAIPIRDMGPLLEIENTESDVFGAYSVERRNGLWGIVSESESRWAA